MTEASTGSQRRHIELANNLAAVRGRLARAAENAGRNVEEIELLPITKFFPASDVAMLSRLGCVCFGEARDQEAAAKVATLAGVLPPEARWHMVGQIQRNKARSIAAWADVAHSVSSTRIAAALDSAAEQVLAEGRRSTPLVVYVQVSLDGDVSRGGVDVNDSRAVDELCARVHAGAGLQLAGLMGIPPLGADADIAFARLAAELHRIQGDYEQRLGLSAGMSADLEAAVQHGSTCVRVGTAIMGSRPLTSR